MPWLPLLYGCFGAVFLADVIPRFVSGMMGRPFQSPFAKPPGQAPSWSTIAVLRGSFNIVAGYVLVCRVGDLGLRNTSDVVALGLAVLLTALLLARQFGRRHGGNAPARR